MKESDFLLPSDPPTTRLDFHLVAVCSSKCRFCSEAFRMQAFAKHDFSLKEAIYIMARYAKQGVKHVNITGGEPTLYKHLPQVLAAAKKMGLKTYIATNGIKTHKIEYLRTIAPYLDDFCLSLHGADAQIHDHLTGHKGAFDRLMKTAQNLKEFPHINIFVNTVATKQNKHQLIKIHQIAQQIKAQNHLISNLVPEGLGKPNFYELSIPDDEWPEIADALLSIENTSTTIRFFAVPICKLGKAYTRSNDFYLDPRITVERINIPNKGVGWCAVRSFAPVRERLYTDECQNCQYKGICGGFIKQP